MITVLLVILAIVLAIGAVAMGWLSFDACVRPHAAYQPNDWVILLFIALGLAGVAVFILASLFR